MIRIGGTTWKEHGKLLHKNHLTLAEYASFFPVVEVDTGYYGIFKKERAVSWVKEVPPAFSFVVKAFQGITCQIDRPAEYGDTQEMLAAFKESLLPFAATGQLGAVLLQFPASFTCQKKHIQHLYHIKKVLGEFPLTVELRSSTWYEDLVKKDMYRFMNEQHLTLAMIDEPLVPGKSVPFDLTVTNDKLALFRFHGRNQLGWETSGKDWRKKRTLYCYSEEELQSLAKAVQEVSQKTDETIVIFNNNAGGDAGANAQRLQRLLGIEYDGLHPQQLDLF